MAGPLSGVRILEFSQIIAGPFGCMMLADMGADVIKVEPPGGEPWRVFTQFMPDESKPYQALNRGKRSLVLKLDDQRAQEVVHRLVPTIDVVVINYRPDVAGRLGIDYPTLRALRPDLVYVDNTAFGRAGPWAHRPGYDIVVQAATGLMATDSKLDPSGTPRPMSPAVADFSTGLAIAWATATALFHRERTGEGQLVETSLLATALAIQGSSVMENPAADGTRRHPAREKRRQMQREGAPFEELMAVARPLGAGPFYRAFKTRDGAVAIGALSKGLRGKLRAAVGMTFLGLDDPSYDPFDPASRERSRAAVGEVEATMRKKTSAEWMEIFDREGVPAAPVQFPEDLSEDPQVLANDLLVELEHPVSGPQTMVAPILKFERSRAHVRSASPPLGAHSDDCLREAGYDDDAIARLRADGVVG